MADLINVGAFANDATGDPARTAFQKINGLAAGTIPFGNITVGPPTNGLPPLTINTQPGAGADGIDINYAAGSGYGIKIVGNIPGNLFGVFVENLSANPVANTYGLVVGNDSSNTLVISKTSSANVTPVAVGAPASETSYLLNGGAVPIVLAAAGNNLLTLAPANASFFNTAVTGLVSTQVVNTSVANGDVARIQVTSGATAAALFAQNAATTTSIVTGGPTGAQGCLRTLAGALVFGSSNSYRGQVDTNGTWTLVNVGAQSNASIGAAGVQASFEFAGNGAVAGTSSLGVGQAASGQSFILARGAQSLQIGTSTFGSVLTITSAGQVQISPGAGGPTAFVVTAAPGANCGVFIASGGTQSAIAASGGSSTQINVTGAGAGVPCMRFDSAATTGAATPTLGAVKPGSATAASQWLPVSLAGTTYYIPCWL